MTRETKVGLLVGLAFIIVIGILLSDHFRSATQPPQAQLADAATNVRDGVGSPGTSNAPIVIVTPADAPPTNRVPTEGELHGPPHPVIPAVPQPVANGSAPAAQGNAADPDIQLVPSNRDGTPITPTPATPATTANELRSYTAQAGDTVSRLAGRFMGGNTKTNRQAIIDANPSLKTNPDRIVVGQVYMIPQRPGSAAPAAGGTDSLSAAMPTATDGPNSDGSASPRGMGNARTTTAAFIYTAKPGDSLWRIANDELGDPSAVGAIQQLNLDVLTGKNHDQLAVGTKLRLPSVPSNVAN